MSNKRIVYTENEILLLKKIKLFDFYEKVIIPLRPNKFKVIPGSEPSAICPCHNDNDPSLHEWKRKSGHVFHCFGCGYTGSVLKMYTDIAKMYWDEVLDRQTVVKRLADIYGIELLPEKEEELVEKSVFERAKSLISDKSNVRLPKGEFSLAEFRELNSKVATLNVPIEVKIENFSILDLRASVALKNAEEAKE